MFIAGPLFKPTGLCARRSRSLSSSRVPILGGFVPRKDRRLTGGTSGGTVMVPLIFPSSMEGPFLLLVTNGEVSFQPGIRAKRMPVAERKRMRGITRTLISVMSNFLATFGKELLEFVKNSKIHGSHKSG